MAALLLLADQRALRAAADVQLLERLLRAPGWPGLRAGQPQRALS